MIQFDYLHNPRPALLGRLTVFRISQRYRNALAALVAALFVVFATWSIEAVRLSAARDLQARYQVRYERSAGALIRSKALYERLQRVVALDREVYNIQASGNRTAQRLAEIANRLPARAWLTSIGKDPTGLTIEGRAPDLVSVSEAVTRFAASRVVTAPILLGISSDSRSQGGRLRYQLHVEGAP